MPRVTYPLRMPKELLQEVRHAAKETGLTMADIMRLAIKFGVPKVRQTASRERGFAKVAAGMQLEGDTK